MGGIEPGFDNQAYLAEKVRGGWGARCDGDGDVATICGGSGPIPPPCDVWVTTTDNNACSRTRSQSSRRRTGTTAWGI